MKRAFLAAALGLAILAGVGCTDLRPAEERPAPAFTLESLEGRSYTLEDCAGRVCLLAVWATWCPPCVEEVPHLSGLSRRYGEKLLILGVSVDDDLGALREFLQQREVAYPIVLGEDRFLADVGFTGILPTTLILGPSGKIRDRFLGYREPEVLVEAIERHISEVKLPAAHDPEA